MEHHGRCPETVSYARIYVRPPSSDNHLSKRPEDESLREHRSDMEDVSSSLDDRQLHKVEDQDMNQGNLVERPISDQSSAWHPKKYWKDLPQELHTDDQGACCFHRSCHLTVLFFILFS